MAEYGIFISSQYSELSDQDLDQLVGSINEEIPTCGFKQMLENSRILLLLLL